jgi:acyl-CoA-dependent ceramide synthase
VPSRVSSPVLRKAPSSKAGPSFWADLANGQWVINPASSFKLVCGSLAAFLGWEALAPAGAPNPLAPLLLLSHRVPASAPGDARYQKGYLDLVFVAYYVVVWSFVRQTIIVTISRRLARRFGIRSVAKRERFGEQLYAMVYFAFFGIWGIVGAGPALHTHADGGGSGSWASSQRGGTRLSTSSSVRPADPPGSPAPLTRRAGYPEWNMKPELKRYYLMHGAYWTQQAVVMLFGLEKPRKDYYELIAHHAVTLHLIGWSYLVSMTFMGQAVYMSMDIPDAFLAASKLLNYMRFERAKTVMFAVLIPTWTCVPHQSARATLTRAQVLPDLPERNHALVGVEPV